MLVLQLKPPKTLYMTGPEALKEGWQGGFLLCDQMLRASRSARASQTATVRALILYCLYYFGFSLL